MIARYHMQSRRHGVMVEHRSRWELERRRTVFALPVERRGVYLRHCEPWEIGVLAERQYYECGGCGHYHPLGWVGDCRDDSQRYTQDALDAKHGAPHRARSGAGWVEVDEQTGAEV